MHLPVSLSHVVSGFIFNYFSPFPFFYRCFFCNSKPSQIKHEPSGCRFLTLIAQRVRVNDVSKNARAITSNCSQRSNERIIHFLINFETINFERFINSIRSTAITSKDRHLSVFYSNLLFQSTTNKSTGTYR